MWCVSIFCFDIFADFRVSRSTFPTRSQKLGLSELTGSSFASSRYRGPPTTFVSGVTQPRSDRGIYKNVEIGETISFCENRISFEENDPKIYIRQFFKLSTTKINRKKVFKKYNIFPHWVAPGDLNTNFRLQSKDWYF